VTYSSGELAVICKAHRRRCYLKPSRPGGPVRVWHEGATRGDDLCFSQTFLVRREHEYRRDRLLDELAAEFAGR